MELEFSDDTLTAEEYINEQPPIIQSQMNTFCKLMAKKSNMKFMDIRKMALKDWFYNFNKFQEKYGLKGRFDFLEL